VLKRSYFVVLELQCTVHSVRQPQHCAPESTASSMKQLSCHYMQAKRLSSALSKPTITIQSFSDKRARKVRFLCSLAEHNNGSAISSGMLHNNMATGRYFHFQFDMYCALSNHQLSGDVGTPAQTLFNTVLLPKGISWGVSVQTQRVDVKLKYQKPKCSADVCWKRAIESLRLKCRGHPCLDPLLTNITTATQQQGYSLEKATL